MLEPFDVDVGGKQVMHTYRSHFSGGLRVSWRHCRADRQIALGSASRVKPADKKKKVGRSGSRFKTALTTLQSMGMLSACCYQKSRRQQLL